MGQRITRAKAKIKAARIPYRVPSAEDLPARVSGVLAVLFLVFSEGYLATGPDTDPVRHDLTAEAIRLTRLIRALMPEDGEVAEAAGVDAPHRGPPHRPGVGERRAGRPRRAGPRGLGRGAGRRGHRSCASAWRPGWLRVATRSSQRSTPCPSARDVRDTDWSQVVALYDQLVRLDPSPIIALNRAVAVAELDGPEVALAAVDRLEEKLAGYPPTMRPARTCCAGWAAVEVALRTTKPSSWRATPPRPPT